jgi:hypothetical protein
MVDFNQKAARKFCRYTRCRMKLPEPTTNLHEAFCKRGCYDSFHLKICRVCEKPLEQKYRKVKPKTEGAAVKFVKVDNPGPTCGSAKCKGPGGIRLQWADIRSRRAKSSHQAIRVPKNHTYTKKCLCRSTVLGEVRTPDPLPEWHIVAGGPLTPSQMHCATVPDGPDCRWTDGSYERIEASNRRLLKAHFAKLAEKAAIQRQHMPLNIQGGYQPNYRALKIGPEKSLDEIRARVARGVSFDDLDAEQWKLPDPVIPGAGYDRYVTPEPQQPAADWQLSEDLSIPAFLDRRPRPELKEAA